MEDLRGRISNAMRHCFRQRQFRSPLPVDSYAPYVECVEGLVSQGGLGGYSVPALVISADTVPVVAENFIDGSMIQHRLFLNGYHYRFSALPPAEIFE